MTTFIIFVLLLITLYLLLRSHVRASKMILIVTIVLFSMIGVGIFSSYLLNKLDSFTVLAHPTWKKHNAIILLGAGSIKLSDEVKPTSLAYSRLYETARLYFSCKKTNAECKIIITGGDALATGKSEAVVYQQALNEIGIKDSDIMLESQSMNTYENAEFTSALLKTKQFDNIFLVTSGIHMKRALLYFSHFGVKATPSISDYIEPHIFMIPLGVNFAITDFAIHEYIGIIRFYIYNYLGLNIHATAPGSP